MSIDAELIGNLFMQQVAAAMDKKTKQYKKKVKNWIKVERMECQESRKNPEQGAVDAPPRKIKHS